MDGLIGLAGALQGSALGEWARGSPTGYPLANIVHLLGLVLLLGAIGLLDLRLVGLFGDLPAEALAKALIPLAGGGLALLVPSGIVMFAADAGPLLQSPTFRWKLALIAVATANVAAFHLLWGNRLRYWDRGVTFAARAMAAASISLWLTVAALGRLIAYT